jgi:hypothetical protein
LEVPPSDAGRCRALIWQASAIKLLQELWGQLREQGVSMQRIIPGLIGEPFAAAPRTGTAW